jgi:hypothetical protein
MMPEVCYNKEHRFGNGGESMDELEATIENIVFQAEDGRFLSFVFAVKRWKEYQLFIKD